MIIDLVENKNLSNPSGVSDAVTKAIKHDTIVINQIADNAIAK